MSLSSAGLAAPAAADIAGGDGDTGNNNNNKKKGRYSGSNSKDASQDRRNTASYKHKEVNHEKLRLLAHRLERPMGEMLDEALERMFPEWVAQLPAEPRF